MAAYLVLMVATVRICAVIEKPFQSGRIRLMNSRALQRISFLANGTHDSNRSSPVRTVASTSAGVGIRHSRYLETVAPQFGPDSDLT